MKIYQIEISNLCNLMCGYCPHPTQQREKGLMTLQTFAKAIELVRRCEQEQAFLHNFGEPLLHPFLCDFVRCATSQEVSVSFFSNGVLLDEPTASRLVDAGLRELWISAHVPGELERIQMMLERASIPLSIEGTFRPSRATLHDWGGQVTVRSTQVATAAPCIFEREQAAVILWDGRVNICCIDAEGDGVSGTVDDYLADPSRYQFHPIPLCDGCTLMRGDEKLA
jgi:hypothetical protein